jgi:amidase
MGDDATSLAEAIRSGRLTAMEAMQAALKQATLRSDLGAVVHMDQELGLKTAQEMDERMRRGTVQGQPFAGVPALAKDLGGPFRGLPVAAGSRMIGRHPEEEDCDLASRLREIGLCFFGLSTVPEMGLSLSTEPVAGPLCRNPLDLSRTPGGSSGGAAAAVCAGIVAIAHATDAGGSIRVPAACCGLVGLKASRGVMPAGPGFGNHLGGIASELTVSRSVRDLAAAFDFASGNGRGPYADPALPHPKNGRLRVGLVTDCGSAHPLDPDRAHAVQAAGRSLEADGHLLVPISWGRFEGMVETSGRVLGDIIAVNIANFVDGAGLDEERAEPLTRGFIRRGRSLTAQIFWASINAGVRASRELWDVFEEVDLLLTPMLASAPLPLGSFPFDHEETELQILRMTQFAPFASLANVTGFPALTLPYGSDPAGLPLPVQMLAPMGQDRLLLALAQRLESEDRWQHRFSVAGLIQ